MVYDPTIIPLAIGVYLIPAMIGAMRCHTNRLAILVLNILLGWSIIGWIGALVWACTNNPAPGGATNGR